MELPIKLRAFFYLYLVVFIVALPSPSGAQPNPNQGTREADQFSQKGKKVAGEVSAPGEKPEIKEAQRAAPKEGEKKFLIKKIILNGCETFPPEDFTPIVSKYENKEVTLTDMNNLAKDIEGEYIKRGVIAAAFTPPQEIKDGTITIEVLEAKMGDLDIQKAKYYEKKRLEYYWMIPKGETLQYWKISKGVQMMNKSPDREVKATLKAGKARGSTDIILTPTTHFPIHTIYTFDREGTPSTGRNRAGLGFRDNNTTGFLDDMLLTGLSTSKAFSGWYIYHNLPVSNFGTSALYGYNYSLSTPGKDYTVYGMKSVQEVANFSLHQDIYEKDKYLGEIFTGFEAKSKTTWVQGTGTFSNEKLRILSMGGNYTVHAKGGTATLNAELDQGLNLGGAKRSNPLASRPGALPTYTLFMWGGLARANLPFDLQDSIKFKMQIPSEKLYAQEQFMLGGIDSVRGYPNQDVLSDFGYQTNVEMLTRLPFIPPEWKLPYAEAPIRDQVTGVWFFDQGYGVSRGENNGHSLISTGVGLRLNLYNQFMFRFEWGFPLRRLGWRQADNPASEGKAPGRFHVSIDFQDKIPDEIDRITKEIELEKKEDLAYKLIDNEMARPDSPIRARFEGLKKEYLEQYKNGDLARAIETNEKIFWLAKSLYAQAEKYVNTTSSDDLERLKGYRNAAEIYRRAGKLREASALYKKITEEARPKPLILAY